MRTFILILALSSIAMTRFLSTKTPVMENPWTTDAVNGKCDIMEHLDVVSNANGKFAQCMPIIRPMDYHKCPQPPKFDTTTLDAFAVYVKEIDFLACVVECSSAAEGACPEDSTCMDAPAVFQNSNVKKICYYQQPSKKSVTLAQANPSKTPVMENPWTTDAVNGKCDLMEHLDVVSNANGKFAQCMPIIRPMDYHRCPQPPKFDTTKLESYDVYVKEIDFHACVVECSSAAEGDCPEDSTCMDAPAVFQTKFVKKICYYQQPSKKSVTLAQANPGNEVFYENPFTGDRPHHHRECNSGEIVQYYNDQAGNKYGQCMPMISNGGFDHCPTPKEFDSLRIEAFQTKAQHEEVCTLECSNSYNNACPGDSLCMTAPKDLQNDWVNMICVFKQD